MADLIANWKTDDECCQVKSYDFYTLNRGVYSKYTLTTDDLNIISVDSTTKAISVDTIS